MHEHHAAPQLDAGQSPVRRISDDDLLRLVVPDLDRAKLYQDGLRDIRDKALLLYSMSKEADGIRQLNKPGFSQMVAPTVYESVEGMKVGLDQLFTSPDFFSVKAGQDADAGERLRKLLRWNIFEAQYGARELRSWLDCCLKYQYGVLKVFWDEEYREQNAEFDRLDEGQAGQLLQNGWTFSKFEEVYVADTGSVAQDAQQDMGEAGGKDFPQQDAWAALSRAGGDDCEPELAVAVGGQSPLTDSDSNDASGEATSPSPRPRSGKKTRRKPKTSPGPSPGASWKSGRFTFPSTSTGTGCWSR